MPCVAGYFVADHADPSHRKGKQLPLLQRLMFTEPGPRVQTTEQYLTSCRIEGTGSADGTTISQVWRSGILVSDSLTCAFSSF